MSLLPGIGRWIVKATPALSSWVRYRPVTVIEIARRHPSLGEYFELTVVFYSASGNIVYNPSAIADNPANTRNAKSNRFASTK